MSSNIIDLYKKKISDLKKSREELEKKKEEYFNYLAENYLEEKLKDAFENTNFIKGSKKYELFLISDSTDIETEDLEACSELKLNTKLFSAKERIKYIADCLAKMEISVSYDSRCVYLNII